MSASRSACAGVRAAQPAALMAAVEVVVGEEAVEVALDLRDFELPHRLPGHAEALVEERTVRSTKPLVRGERTPVATVHFRDKWATGASP